MCIDMPDALELRGSEDCWVEGRAREGRAAGKPSEKAEPERASSLGRLGGSGAIPSASAQLAPQSSYYKATAEDPWQTRGQQVWTD